MLNAGIGKISQKMFLFPCGMLHPLSMIHFEWANYFWVNGKCFISPTEDNYIAQQYFVIISKPLCNIKGFL